MYKTSQNKHNYSYLSAWNCPYSRRVNRYEGSATAKEASIQCKIGEATEHPSSV